MYDGGVMDSLNIRPWQGRGGGGGEIVQSLISE